MTVKERKQLLLDMNSVQKEIKIIQRRLNSNPSLLKDKEFQEQRTRLFYKSYYIDCILHNIWAVSYNVYVKGE